MSNDYIVYQYTSVEFKQLQGETKPPLKLQRIFPIRWAPSVLNNLEKIRREWPFLVGHTEQLSSDRAYSDVAREKASNNTD